MSRTILVLGAAALAACSLTGCGSSSEPLSEMTPAPQSQAQTLDTAQVLALAQQSSETSTPFQVNDGAVTLTDTSETSDPISVNAM